jgi:hypothetical protein
VLWSPIKSLEWSFFGRNAEGRFEWAPQWPKSRGRLPSMIRLRLNDQERFAFILPTQEPLVLK